MLATQDLREPKVMDYRPLKVEFRLRTPICLTFPFIFFDGLVAHLMNRYLDPEGYRALPSKRAIQEVGDVRIPIKRFNLPNGEYIYHASVSFFDTKNAYTTTIYKRFCEQFLDLQKIKRRKIDTSRGFFKNYAIKLIYIPTRKVTFYTCGDPDALDFLLEGLPALGKKTAIGFGMIKDYTIREVSDDFSIIKDGRAMRPIPIEVVKSANEIIPMAYKPPYWAKENVRPCVPPLARCEL